MEEHGERCQKCGEAGEDRRTLWMACLYEMGELGLPFGQIKLRGTAHAYKGEKQIDGTKISIAQFADEPKGPPRDHAFFTLRVCKNCRSTWMAAIRNWFNTPVERREGCGSGIFVRENGAIIEITEEEWQIRQNERRNNGD